MTAYSVTLANWNSAAFWSAINEPTAGATLDFSDLPSPFAVDFDAANGRVTISDGAVAFVIGDASNIGRADATLGGTTLWGDFTTLHFGDGNDTISGNGTAHLLDGGGGNDFIFGGMGGDSLSGGDGNDVLVGGAGADTLDGGGWYDTADYSGSAGAVHIDLSDAMPETGGDAEGDVLSGIERIYGSQQGDTIIAGDTGMDVAGNSGADSLVGGAGNDRFWGGTSNDTLIGGAGNDLLSGQEGHDRIEGGAGNDTFVYAPGDGLDTIIDFNSGNTGALDDGDATNNDFIDLAAFYDNIAELQDDHADDGILNQSNQGNIVWGQSVDYSDNAAFGDGAGIVLEGQASDGTSFTVENTGVVCFASGTRILTAKGPRPIETLRPGERVVTRDNGPQPLLWLGARRLDAASLAATPALRPIRIAAGAFGPHAALVVSAQHGMLLCIDGEERLVRATHLAAMRGGKVRRMDGCRGVTYWHMMFERHQVVFSNGIPSESLFPGPRALGSLAEAARAELDLLFPDLLAVTSVEEAARVYGEPARPYARTGALPGRLSLLSAPSLRP